MFYHKGDSTQSVRSPVLSRDLTIRFYHLYYSLSVSLNPPCPFSMKSLPPHLPFWLTSFRMDRHLQSDFLSLISVCLVIHPITSSGSFSSIFPFNFVYTIRMLHLQSKPFINPLFIRLRLFNNLLLLLLLPPLLLSFYWRTNIELTYLPIATIVEPTIGPIEPF